MKYLILISLIFSYAASASNDCVIIKDSKKRLSCYDGKYNKETISSGEFEINTGVNPIDDSKTVTVHLDSTESISRYGKPIVFIARCKSNRTDVFVNWRQYLGSDRKRVIVRVGKDEAKNYTWDLSTDSRATFVPNGIDFLKSLFSSEKLVLQTTPYNEGNKTAVFNIKGIEEATKSIREHCNW